MIYATVTVTVDDRSCSFDKRIVLYRGDKNVEVRFVIKGNNFIVLDSTYAQMIIKRPSASSVFSTPELIQNDTVVFVISGNMIDEMREIGAYTFQIRLFDNEMNAQATLPPCVDCILIEEPIVTEETSLVGYSEVNNTPVMAASEDPGDIYDENGDYNKTDWLPGDLITDVKLNKIEEALYLLNEKNQEQDEVIANLPDITDIDLSAYAEIVYVDEQIDAHTHEEYLTEHQDISHLATKEEIPSLEGFATEEYVRGEIDNIESVGMSPQEKAQLEKNTSDINIILGVIDTPPTYTKPALSLGFNKTTVEHGITASIVINPTFRQNDGGVATGYTLFRDGVQVYTNTKVVSYTDFITPTHGSTTSYSANVTYEDGPIKDTLLGVPYPSTSIKAGSVSGSGTVKAYAPSYYGVITASTITLDDISSLSSRLASGRSFTHTVNLAEQRIVYMYPTSFGALTSIKDANNFDYINSYTRSTLSYNSVDYYVYILTDPVTITGFKQIFS